MTKQETAVEWLEDCFKRYGTLLESDFIKAKEMEKEQQGYSEGDMETAWNSSEQNMRFQFSSSKYKNVTFSQWLEKFRNK